MLFSANFLTARQFPGAAEWLLGAAAFALLYFGTLRPGMSEEAASLFYTASHGAWHLLICAASTMYVMRATHTRLGAPTVRTKRSSACAASAGSQREGCVCSWQGEGGAPAKAALCAASAISVRPLCPSLARARP